MKRLVILGLVMLALGVVPVTAKLGDPDPQDTATKTQFRDQIRDARVQAKETLRLRLQVVRDERKQEQVQRLSDRLCSVNENRVNVMEKHLAKMEEMLVRVEKLAAERKTAGKDISAVTGAITSARTAISAANSAVQNQNGISCVLNISGSENTLGAEVNGAINRLNVQLRAVNQKINFAREAVRTAVRELAKVMGEEEGGVEE
jgi:hypothetical protein